MIKETIPIINKLGLHARASGKLLETAIKFQSKISVDFNGQVADARNIMGLLLLGAGYGKDILLTVDGVDEQEALQAIKELFENRFGEGG